MSLVRDLSRFALAGIGPVSGAAAQFVLSLVLLRLLSEQEFGAFAFLFVVTQLLLGVWGALFCAPLPFITSANMGRSLNGPIRSVFAVSLLGALGTALAIFLLARVLLLTAEASFFCGAFSTFLLQRWTARAYAFAELRVKTAIASDLVYAAVVLGGCILIYYFGAASLTVAYSVLFAGAALSFLPFGFRRIRSVFTLARPPTLLGYAPVWRAYSGWSLVGVLTTEITANVHAYGVTTLYGPAAYAPIAATGLLIRPVTVAMNALGDVERARLARHLAEHADAVGIDRSLKALRSVLCAVWLGTAALIAGIFWYHPQLAFPVHYPSSEIALGLALWMAIAAVRVLRTPESTLLQAAGRFRALAWASILSAGFSACAVFALLVLREPLWSLSGILFGEFVFAGAIWRQKLRWRKDLER